MQPANLLSTAAGIVAARSWDDLLQRTGTHGRLVLLHRGHAGGAIEPPFAAKTHQLPRI